MKALLFGSSIVGYPALDFCLYKCGVASSKTRNLIVSLIHNTIATSVVVKALMVDVSGKDLLEFEIPLIRQIVCYECGYLLQDTIYELYARHHCSKSVLFHHISILVGFLLYSKFKKGDYYVGMKLPLLDIV